MKAVGSTGLVNPHNHPLPMKSDHELYYTKANNSKFNLIINIKKQTKMKRTMKSIIASVVKLSSNVDVADAECRYTEEKKKILDDLKSNSTLAQCNELITELLQKELADQGLEALSKVDKHGRKTSIFVDNIIVLLKKQGRLKEAQVLYKNLLIVCRKVEGPKNQESLCCMYKLANILMEGGHFVKARYLLGIALAAQREVMGSNHEDTLTSIATLGLLLSQIELFGDAILLYKEILDGRRLVLGLKHPHTLTVLNNLAVLLYQQHLFDQALRLLKESLKKSHEELGPRHPDTLCSISNLAVVLKDQGLFDQARPLYEKALNLKGEILGSECPSTLRAINNFAIFLKQRGQYRKARILFEEVIMGRKKLLAPIILIPLIPLGALSVCQSLRVPI